MYDLVALVVTKAVDLLMLSWCCLLCDAPRSSVQSTSCTMFLSMWRSALLSSSHTLARCALSCWRQAASHTTPRTQNWFLRLWYRNTCSLQN